MGIKETLQTLIAALQTVTTTTPDGVESTMFVQLWNNQIERKKEGDGYVYPTPACFIETTFSEGMQVGEGATSYEVTFRLLIDYTHMNTEGSFDQDFGIIDIKNGIHRLLNGAKLPNCSPLYQSGKTLDHNHDNSYLCIIEYSTHFIDLVASGTDLLIESTLTNPTLQIEEYILSAPPYTPPTQYSAINIGVYQAMYGSSAATQTYTCGENINSHNPIALVDGLVYNFDAGNIDHLDTFVGFSLTSGVTNGIITVQKEGVITLNGWGLTVGNYFAQLYGGMSLIDHPANSFKKVLGRADTPSTFLILNYEGIIKY